MKHWIYLPLVAGIVLGGILLAITRDWLLVPVAVLLAMAPAVLAAWWQTRKALAAYYAKPVRMHWLDAPPAPPGESAVSFDAELRELGYAPVGWLAPEGEGRSFFAVYLHGSLPIYALVAMAWDASGVFATIPQMESFLPGGGRLSTTASADFGRLTAAARTAGPRLVQLRAFGPVTATALDGQHTGTVGAWIAGKREFLPATGEALIGYLTADHETLRDALAAAGWVPLGLYIRSLFGTPREILKF